MTARCLVTDSCLTVLPVSCAVSYTHLRQAVLDNLVADIKRHGNRLTTGDVGLSLIHI